MHRKKPASSRISRIEELRWDDVRLFLALARGRTVGEAATTLGVDGSTVSRRLVALEDALGVSLFDRGRDGVSATKAADDLVPVAEEMELVAQRFTSAVEGLEREVSGLVRITCPADIAEVMLAPRMPALFARHPLLHVAIEAGEAVLDLTRREADLALRIVRPTSGDLVVSKLRTVRWVAAATPALARSLGIVRSWNELPWVAWGDQLAHIPPARWLGAHVKTEIPRVRSDSLRVQVAMVTAGVGVALLPEPSLGFYGLEPIELARGLRGAASEWPVDELFLVTHRALKDVPRVRAVCDFVREELAARS